VSGTEASSLTSAYFTAARGGIDLPLSYYGAGSIDPGWYWTSFSERGRGRSRQYLCQSLDEIMALPVGELFLDNAAVALWCTQYANAKGWPQDALRAWNFEPQTTGAWGKRTKTGKWFFGLGKILRSCAEFYIIGTRGHPPVRSRSVRNFIEAPWRGESVKPDELHRDMERLYDGPYVELFARRPYPGWDCWGNHMLQQPTLQQSGVTSCPP
jgi:N6-adenosine-specific RNA methylase IME4